MRGVKLIIKNIQRLSKLTHILQKVNKHLPYFMYMALRYIFKDQGDG